MESLEFILAKFLRVLFENFLTIEVNLRYNIPVNFENTGKLGFTSLNDSTVS